MTVTNRYAHESRFIELTVVREKGYYRRGVLVLQAVVSRSDEKGCAPGGTGALKLIHSSIGDAVELRGCGYALVLASSERPRVSGRTAAV